MTTKKITAREIYLSTLSEMRKSQTRPYHRGINAVLEPNWFFLGVAARENLTAYMSAIKTNTERHINDPLENRGDGWYAWRWTQVCLDRGLAAMKNAGAIKWDELPF